jgi:hypothetical protein
MDHCGACDMACSGGMTCQAGSCSCLAGQEDCGGACVDLQVDMDHCGACDMACGGGMTCQAGTCSCSSGREDCGGACVDLLSDPSNCGTCATVCGAGQVCDGTGNCALSCQVGLAECESTCVDPLNSRFFCGADPADCATDPGIECAAGEICEGGACVLSCQENLDPCSGVCVDLERDPANCGACGTACSGGETCQAGACTCPTGQDDCSGVCVDLQRDPANCGVCGTACSGGKACQAGACTCPTGQDDCAGTCILSSLLAAQCDDGDPCTVDGCSATGCTHGPVTGTVACDDGDPCTVNDVCTAGSCGGVASGDTDSDGAQDSCDNCPTVSNLDQADANGISATAIVYAPVADTAFSALPTLTSGAAADIGFTFTMFGTDYTQFTPYDPGLIGLGASSWTCASLSMVPILPCDETIWSVPDLIAGGWSSAWMGNMVTQALLEGTAPSRRLVVNMTDETAIQFQVMLYEGTGAIEVHTVMHYSGPMSTRGVAHNVAGSPLGAYLPDELDTWLTLEHMAVRFTTGLAPDGIGDACQNQVTAAHADCSTACL